MVIIFGVLGLMLIVMAKEHNMDLEAIRRVVNIFRWVMVLYIATPITYSFIGLYEHYREMKSNEQAE
jgi:cobalamin biosynthesis protein CobD/CbiB